MSDLPQVTLPPPPLRYSPPDGSFVPMTNPDGSASKCVNSYTPPHGIFVEFYAHENPQETLLGLTAVLGTMGPWRKCTTVFVTVEDGMERVYFTHQVSKWRQRCDVESFTPGMKTYLEGSYPVVR